MAHIGISALMSPFPPPQEIYQTGTIPVLLQLVGRVVREFVTGSSPQAGPSPLPTSRITDMQV